MYARNMQSGLANARNRLSKTQQERVGNCGFLMGLLKRLEKSLDSEKQRCMER